MHITQAHTPTRTRTIKHRCIEMQTIREVVSQERGGRGGGGGGGRVFCPSLQGTRLNLPGRSRLSLRMNFGFAVMHSPNLLQPTIAATGIAAAWKSCRSDLQPNVLWDGVERLRHSIALTCDTHGTASDRKFANLLPPARPSVVA